MTPNDLLDSVNNLRTELELQNNVPAELIEQARRMDIKLHQMMESNELKAEEDIISELMTLETQFASEHPVIERIIRQLMDSLSQMGI